MTHSVDSAPHLLADLLRAPTADAQQRMAALLNTPDGFASFSEAAAANNPLAFIYLKQNALALPAPYSAHPFLLSLISAVSAQNRPFLAAYLETLSLHSLLPLPTLEHLISSAAFDLLASAFLKYTALPRSDALFREIAWSIAHLEATLVRVYFSSSDTRALASRTANPLFFSPHLLSIVHSLLFQDIHPFFEDRAPLLFQALPFLREDLDCNRTALQIYDLFWTKYPECADAESTLATLCTATEADSAELRIIARAYQFRPVERPRVVALARRLLAAGLFGGDGGDGGEGIDAEDAAAVEDYTRDVLRGVDVQRGSIGELLRAVDRVDGAAGQRGAVLNELSGEALLYAAAELKARHEGAARTAAAVAAGTSGDASLLFSAYRYLLVAEVPARCDPRVLSTPARWVALKYLAEAARRADGFYARLFGLGGGAALPVTLGTEDFVRLAQAGDEFSAELFLRMILAVLTEEGAEKAGKTGKAGEAVEGKGVALLTVYRALLAALTATLETAASRPLQLLLEAFVTLSYRLSLPEPRVVQVILEKELVDLYPLCFYYISLFPAAFPRDVLLRIVAEEKAWGQRAWWGGLVCVVLGMRRAGCLTDGDVAVVGRVLRGYWQVVLRVKTGVAVELVEEGGEVVPGEVRRLLLGEAGVEESREWLLGAFIDRKYLRLVLRKLVAAGADAALVQAVAAKNRRWLSWEAVPRGVVEAFGL